MMRYVRTSNTTRKSFLTPHATLIGHLPPSFQATSIRALNIFILTFRNY